MNRDLIILVCTLACLAGCRGPTRTVTLEVARNDRPLPAAHVYAIALDTSDVPLPVTIENLNKAASAIAVDGVTDADGRVSLTLDAASPYWIDVSGAIGVPDAAGSWVLSVGGDALHQTEIKDRELTLTLVR